MGFLGFFGWVFLGGFFWVGFLLPTLPPVPQAPAHPAGSRSHPPGQRGSSPPSYTQPKSIYSTATKRSITLRNRHLT